MSLENALRKSKMYELGMAHVFMARNMSDFHQMLLKRYGLSSIEWLVLGVVADATSDGGIRVTDLATTFSVKTTYITMILNNLRSKDYVENRYDASDARVRLAILTKKGAKEVPVIERYMQKELVRQLDGVVSSDEFEKYVCVIKKLAHIR